MASQLACTRELKSIDTTNAMSATLEGKQPAERSTDEQRQRISKAPILRIVPPLNFCPVEKQLYRSGQPLLINQLFLEQLHLKTIVWLASEEPNEDILDYCLGNNINIEFVGLINDYNYTNINPWDSLDERTIKNALGLLCDKRNYPLLVCCGMGRHRTGAVIGCLRRLQGWNLASVSEEYRRFAGAKGGRILVELLIENFDVLAVDSDPEQLPEFLK